MFYAYDADKRKRVRCAKQGFTLIELMIAIIIVGIIAGGSVYFAMTVLQRAKRSATSTTLQTINLSIMGYKSEKGEYPRSLQELVSAGFLKKPLPKDGWERNFVYRVTPDGKNPYELFSYGPDGKGGNKASRITIQNK